MKKKNINGPKILYPTVINAGTVPANIDINILLLRNIY